MSSEFLKSAYNGLAHDFPLYSLSFSLVVWPVMFLFFRSFQDPILRSALVAMVIPHLAISYPVFYISAYFSIHGNIIAALLVFILLMVFVFPQLIAIVSFSVYAWTRRVPFGRSWEIAYSGLVTVTMVAGSFYTLAAFEGLKDLE